MPWEIDYALLSFTQFKKSKYHLDPNDIVKIDTTLNLSSYIIDWDKSKLPKEYFIQKYKDLSILLEDYIHTPYIYDGDKLFGILDKQRRCYEIDVDSGGSAVFSCTLEIPAGSDVPVFTP